MWSYCAGLYQVAADDHPQRVSKYEKYDEDPVTKINTEGIVFPLEVTKINKLEKLNPMFGINVFRIGKNKDECRIEYISDNFKMNQSIPVINLGRYEFCKGDNVKQHYVWIKNLSALYTNKFNQQAHICFNCMNQFSTEQARNNHFNNCITNNPNSLCMPNEGNNEVYFKNHNKKLPSAFIITEDFESILVPCKKKVLKYVEEIEFIDGKEVKRMTKKEIEESYDEHKAAAYVAFVMSDYPLLIEELKKYIKPQPHVAFFKNHVAYTYRGESTDDIERQYFSDTQEIQNAIKMAMKLKLPLNMTQEDEAIYANATQCHICEKPLRNIDEQLLAKQQKLMAAGKQKNNRRRTKNKRWNRATISWKQTRWK